MHTFWPWWWGGLAIAGIAVGFPWLTGNSLGVSGTYVSALASLKKFYQGLFQRKEMATAAEAAEALRKLTEEEFGPQEISPEMAANMERFAAANRSKRARPWFLVGIVFGAALIRFLEGAWPDSAWSLGVEFDARFGSEILFKVVYLFFCGLAIGVGTRMSGGCTSGHGISGVACGQRGSLLSTATFWSVGVAVTWILQKGFA